ncbi:flavodoxin domain-containing protein [Tetragenococcus koreensis]|uniref:flavodoxin domain-containing protein n=1 Tax=Tetragenococcus koreensis TaxID=290335 RepID=UPI001F38D240|nr:flavodoxin domain-containing protein [Tetragenococcus koreensis]MCF1585062.1 flavodoxin domain-containing protein [Tetragenococcus koreensis]MCF1629410.1 flavodoxin domain-containing protein [Tetragenococcus koreensis]
MLEGKFQNQGVEVIRMGTDDAEDADEEAFTGTDICVIATYTYNNGEVPANFVYFEENLRKQNLKGKVYGVVGSGDKGYHSDTYCFAAETFNEDFQQAGTKKGHDVLKIDNKADEKDKEALKEFVSSLTNA